MSFVFLILSFRSMNSTRRLTRDELIEKRRRILLQRTSAARLQLDSLSSLDSSYKISRENLHQCRLKFIEQIHQSHQMSLDELNQTYEQLNRVRSNIFHLFNEQNSVDQNLQMENQLNKLRHAEFQFDFDSTKNQFSEKFELLKIVHPSASRRFFNKSNTKCRLLIRRDRFEEEISLYEHFLTRVDGPTGESILICPLDFLAELISNENEIRILIDQSYLPSIRSHFQRMLTDYDLIRLQLASESCPQSTEFVIQIISHDSTKLFACLEEIFTICNQQEKAVNSILYNPIHSNRSKVHLYGGYSDVSFSSQISSSSTETKSSPSIFVNFSSSSTSNSSQNHFDRVLMPVSVRRTMTISDTQAGALLGPKGERIQQLQRETGAIVTISDLSDENPIERRKRNVFIQGSEQQVNKALQAIGKLLTI